MKGSTTIRKHARKPPFADRLALWMSHSRVVDSLWIGTMGSEPELDLRRIEEALFLIKRHDELNYSRVIRNLSRIWVNVIPSSTAHYDRSLNACVLDERFTRNEATTVEDIASTIIHEATHARLESWGVVYDEARRSRIEAICMRRELDFARHLPNSEPLLHDITARLEWCVGERDLYADVNFQRRRHEGSVEALRYLNAPNWLIRWATWLIRRRRQREPASLES